MERSVLIGNGINIQFGGKDYLNSSIISRLEKNIATTGRYTDIFAGTVDAEDMAGLISKLYDWSLNHVFKGIHSISLVANQDEFWNVLRMSKEYSEQSEPSVLSVGMEDYLLLLKLFDAQYPEEEQVYTSAAQACCWLLLDALYNEGRLQEIHKSMDGVQGLFEEYDSIFTVNYDTNIDNCVSKKVYHLHGSFETLHHEYDPATLKGWALQKVNGSLLPIVDSKKYLYCNAILGFSGEDKLRKINQYNEIYESAVTKVLRDQHPDLKMEPYPFGQFKAISGELDIIGMNPNNDSHIFRMINENRDISKVVYYYHDKRQIDRVKVMLPEKTVDSLDVRRLWDSL